LEYSQIVRSKLKQRKIELIQSYDEDKSTAIINRIVKSIRRLEMFPQSGTAVSSQYGIECDYRYIFVEHNYFFYRMKDGNTILILEMFHEKEVTFYFLGSDIEEYPYYLLSAQQMLDTKDDFREWGNYLITREFDNIPVDEGVCDSLN